MCALCQDLKDMVRIFHLTPLAQSSRNLWCLELSSIKLLLISGLHKLLELSSWEPEKKIELPFSLWMWMAIVPWYILMTRFMPKKCPMSPNRSLPSLPLRSDFRSTKRTYSWKILVAWLIPIVGQQPEFWCGSLHSLGCLLMPLIPLHHNEEPARCLNRQWYSGKLGGLLAELVWVSIQIHNFNEMSWNFLDLGFLKIAESEVNHSSNHQEFQVPKMEVLNLIGLFWGVVFPLDEPLIRTVQVYRCTGFLYLGPWFFFNMFPTFIGTMVGNPSQGVLPQFSQWSMSHEKNPSCFGYLGVYTTQLYEDYNQHF